jgi:hypothetical protein
MINVEYSTLLSQSLVEFQDSQVQCVFDVSNIDFTSKNDPKHSNVI